jgi:hypothetical protein
MKRPAWLYSVHIADSGQDIKGPDDASCVLKTSEAPKAGAAAKAVEPEQQGRTWICAWQVDEEQTHWENTFSWAEAELLLLDRPTMRIEDELAEALEANQHVGELTVDGTADLTRTRLQSIWGNWLRQNGTKRWPTPAIYLVPGGFELRVTFRVNQNEAGYHLSLVDHATDE